MSLPFGRIIKEDGQVTGIVEFKDLQESQMDITEMNVGEYCFDNKSMFEALKKVTNNNAQAEYYITDLIGIMMKKARRLMAIRFRISVK